jgi:hypothetical protein
MPLLNLLVLNQRLHELPHLCSAPSAGVVLREEIPMRCQCERAQARLLHLLAEVHWRCDPSEDVIMAEAAVIEEQLRSYRLWSERVLGNLREAADLFELIDLYL